MGKFLRKEMLMQLRHEVKCEISRADALVLENRLRVLMKCDRPMIAWIFESGEYTELYHSLFKEFIETVDILGIIEKAEAIISPYVEKDPTKFCTYEEYEKGVAALNQYCTLRNESIAKQLESGETAVQQSYADASSLNISDMGTMGGMFPSGGGSDYGEDGSQQGGMQRPDMGGSQSFPNMGSSNAPAEIGGWLWIAVSVIVLGIGILVAKIYKI